MCLDARTSSVSIRDTDSSSDHPGRVSPSLSGNAVVFARGQLMRGRVAIRTGLTLGTGVVLLILAVPARTTGRATCTLIGSWRAGFARCLIHQLLVGAGSARDALVARI